MNTQLQSTSEQLIEKWSPVLDHADYSKIDTPHKRAVTAQLLENQTNDSRENAKWGLGSLLNEAAPTNAMGASSSTAGDGAIDIYDPVLISLVRRSMPNLIAYDICGVQPMTGPTGLIFALRPRYNNQTGAEALYNEANSSFSATAAGNNAHQSANSQWAAQTGTSPSQLSSGTEYNFQTGFDTGFAEALGDNAGNAFQEMGFSVEKVAVTAVSRALKAEYTIELAQDLKAVHGLDAEVELSNILSTEVLAEINREVVRSINNTATIGAQENTATAGTFDLDIDSNGRWMVEKFKGLHFQLEREANAIAKATRRGKGNIVLCSSDVASALQMTGMLDYTPAMNNNLNVDDTGNTFAGVLNGRYKVYVDPYHGAVNGNNYITVGYRGPSQFDAGMFYCPYVPLQMVRAVGENNFQPKIGFKTRYGMVANPFATSAADGAIAFANKNIYYRRFNVSNLM